MNGLSFFARLRPVASVIVTVLAAALVWYGLVGPDRLDRFTFGQFLRIPVEALVLVALMLLLPTRAARITTAVIGLLLGLLVVVKVLDMGFYEPLDRPFNPVTDRGNFGPAIGVLRDSIGPAGTTAIVVAFVLFIIAVIGSMTLSMVRLTALTTAHRRASIRTGTVFAVVWVLCAVFGIQFTTGTPVASTSAAALAADQVAQVRDGIADRRAFDRGLADPDPVRGTPSSDLLTGLRGKDVLIVFVESYGQVAVQGSSFSAQDDATLRAGTADLTAAGYSAQSAFLTSPTFGGISWLAHSTLQSGLWIDNQGRYDTLMTTDRYTLSDAFKQAGWRTVADVPSNKQNWPQGTSFYHYDQIYDDRNVGYAGPNFSYGTMPDQYVLAAFQRQELAAPHAPVMAELDLVSSHTPWAPLPRMVPWDLVGNGSIFTGMPRQGQKASVVWRDPRQVQAAYGQSIRYTMNTLVSFVAQSTDRNLVLVVLGDHEPATIVSGTGASHNVPVSIISRDPAVLNRISGWGWQDGLLPDPQAPVWPMDTFRNRFLTAYGSSAG